MTDVEFGQVAIALKSKPSQEGLAWEESAEVYYLVLAPIASDYVGALVRWVLLECKTWRPTTDRIYDWYRKRMGTRVDGADIVGEIRAGVARYGVYGRPDPDNARVRTAGAPEGLSDAARRLVERQGGWAAICTHPYADGERFWRHLEAEADSILEGMQIEAERANSRRLRKGAL